jgi:hypothetical protein
MSVVGYDMTIITGDGPYLSDELGYFRLNLWGMAMYLQCMRALGMLATDYSPDEVPWESGRQAFLARTDVEDESDFLCSEEGGLVLAWRPSTRDSQAGEESPQPGMAFHKFCSNDRWVVTAQECREALAAWRVAVARSLPAGAKPSRADERHLIADVLCSVGEVESEMLVELTATLERTGAGVYVFGQDDTLEDEVDYWFEWLAYLERASRYVGFCVD